ncbi:hypothetical protein ACH5RR_021228 [Cinchona calisaya]|uniref:Uncharacterized protein n=1 Tax=Cinchona calisaya TaxID=153742 RepID=A0ABD2ZGQ6_9GENT
MILDKAYIDESAFGENRIVNLKEGLGSISLKCLKRGAKIFNEGVIWTVRNGRKVRLWWDMWLECGSQRSLISGPFLYTEDTTKVCDLLKDKGNEISLGFPSSCINLF